MVIYLGSNTRLHRSVITRVHPLSPLLVSREGERRRAATCDRNADNHGCPCRGRASLGRAQGANQAFPSSGDTQGTGTLDCPALCRASHQTGRRTPGWLHSGTPHHPLPI